MLERLRQSLALRLAVQYALVFALGAGLAAVGPAHHRPAAPLRLGARIVDREQHGAGVRQRGLGREEAGQLGVGPQLARLEQRPHLTRVLGLEQLGREPAE